MFFKKEFIKIIPFPFFLAFTYGVAGLPISVLMAWTAHNFTTSFCFLWPPAPLVPWLLASALLQGTLSIFDSIAFFASDLDLVILMRLTLLIWNGLFGFLFLGERLSIVGSLAVLIVIIGIALIVSNFQWSTSKIPSVIQFGLHSVTVFLMSVGSLLTKRSMAVISETNGNFKVFDYIVWVTLFSVPTTLYFWLTREWESWRLISTILTSDVMAWMIFGAALHELLSLCIAEMHKEATLISMGIISQLRLLATLTVSYFVYRATQWSILKLIGVALLAVGGVIYSITRVSGDAHKSIDTSELAGPGDVGHAGFSRVVDPYSDSTI
jgi:drug/metabolite transporter (DMT)-like permease